MLEANDGLERACALALCLADLAVTVDDVPDNLSVLHDIVLLDAMRFWAAALPRPRHIWNAST